MPPELTTTRLHLLSAVLRLGSRATIARLAAERDTSKQAVGAHVRALRSLGYLKELGGDRYAPVELTDAARRILNLGIPIYGRIAAGPPTMAEQSPDRVADLETLLGMREGDFLLKIEGDSMTGIGVLHGDYVVIRPAEEVQDGEVAVVLIPGENAATLKRLYHFGGEVLLRSENPSMPQMSFPADQVQVQGKMVGRVGVGVPRVSARWG